MVFRTECTYQVYSEWITTQLEQVTVKASFIPARRPMGIVHSWILRISCRLRRQIWPKEAQLATGSISSRNVLVQLAPSVAHRYTIYMHRFRADALRSAPFQWRRVTCRDIVQACTIGNYHSSSWRFILPHTLQFFASISNVANGIRFDDK